MTDFTEYRGYRIYCEFDADTGYQTWVEKDGSRYFTSRNYAGQGARAHAMRAAIKFVNKQPDAEKLR